MHCTFADWEIKNLGCKSVEIVIEKKDISKKKSDEIIEEIESYRIKYDAKYIVVKANTNYTELSRNLQKHGFWLIEVQGEEKLTREMAIHSIEKYSHLYPGMDYHEANDEESLFILDEILKGIFTTDRIAVDPIFGIELANRRYVNWIKDELKRGTPLFLVFSNQKPIGFFMNRKLDCLNWKGILLGRFKNEWSQGLGAMLFLAENEDFVYHGGNMFRANVSLNNPKIVKLHTLFGRELGKFINVFVQHYD